jgi:transposase
MDIHKNARLSFRSREALARFVVEHRATRKAAAVAFRVSAKAVAKWVARFQIAGLDGLMDRSSRPHRSPRRMPVAVAERVVELRRGHMPRYEIARRTRAESGLSQPHPAPRAAEPMARPEPSAARQAL